MMSTVVLLIRNAAKSDFGGAETYQISLANILKKEGYTPIVISRSQKLISYAKNHGIQIQKGWWWSHQNWNGKQLLLFPLYLVWQIILTVWYIALIIRTGASILHIQSKDDFIAATIAGRLTFRRVIWTDHMDLRYIFQNITRPFRNPLGKLVFITGKLAHHIIVISNNEHRLITQQFKNSSDLNKQIVIVKNGVVDQPALYKESQLHTNEVFTYCLASRIVANKGIGEAIDAFISLKNQQSPFDAALAIYGDGADLDLYKQRSKKYTDIIFYGHQSNAISKIADSDVFILPSYQEGFSIALLEATMLGKPIIASNVDSNSEIISDGKTGLLVPPRNPEQLSHAMLELYTNDELRNAVKKAARENYEKHYNLENIVKDKIIPLYSNL